MIAALCHLGIGKGAHSFRRIEFVIGHGERDHADITILACFLEIAVTHMRDSDNGLWRGARNDEIAIVIGHALVEGVSVIDGQQCHIGETHGDVLRIQHLADEAHRVALGALHEDVGIELGDPHGIITAHLSDSLQDGGLLYMGGDPEILQVVIDEIDGDGVAVAVQYEEGFRERDILEIVTYGLSLRHGQWQDDDEDKYDELFHCLMDDGVSKDIAV